MTIDNLRALVDFHYWARDRVLDAVEALSPEQFTRDLGNSFLSIRDTLWHVYWAECIWLTRWEGLPPPSGGNADLFADPATVRRSWLTNEQRLRAFVDGLSNDDVERVLEYRNLAGQAMASRIGEMIQHVVNHGTYHRGQVTTMLRQVGGAAPKSTDLIVFYRERAA